MKPNNKHETRGRPREFAEPDSFNLRIEKSDRPKWEAAAKKANYKSLNQFANAAINEKASKVSSSNA